jgi:hypothetical protein
MTHIARLDLNNYRHRIAEDVKNLIEKYHVIIEGHVPDIDANLAGALFFKEMRTALKNIQNENLEKIVN